MGIQTSGPVMVIPVSPPTETEFQPFTVALKLSVCPPTVPEADSLHQGRKVEMNASSPAAAKTRSGIAILR
jgi:hypothetical protein